MDLFSSLDATFDSANDIINYNLPDAEIILYRNFFSQKESQHLYQQLISTTLWQQEKIKFYGKLHDLPRLTAWYGDSNKPYTYSGIAMNPNPWTPELLLIKQKIEKVSNVIFSSVLLNLYRNGSDSVSWHSDDERELGLNPTIGSVSLGESRIFQLKHKTLDEKENIVLSNGSFLLMSGKTQHFWKHQIPKSARPLQPRINLTFRVIS
jgi:alkylated DNA repair dioxygenase AlkB